MSATFTVSLPSRLPLEALFMLQTSLDFNSFDTLLPRVSYPVQIEICKLVDVDSLKA